MIFPRHPRKIRREGNGRQTTFFAQADGILRTDGRQPAYRCLPKLSRMPA